MEHLSSLEKKSCVQTAEFQLERKHQKCYIFEYSVEFCDNKIDNYGLHKTGENVKAEDAQNPVNVTGVHAFLGLVNNSSCQTYLQSSEQYTSRHYTELHGLRIVRQLQGK